MSMPEPFLLNEHYEVAAQLAPSGADEVREFHRTLPAYTVTPLLSLPRVATELGLGTVLLKDESSRFGLPAFKMLGASWAVHRALAARDSAAAEPRLVTATDGNHGRAVARMAKLLGLSATIFVPRGVSEKAISLIRGEGARVELVDASYDDTVQRAAKLADEQEDALLIQDTSWPGYEDVPQWIVDGYATLFDEAAEQAAELGLGIDLLVVPAGVGSLAHAAVLFARSRPTCKVITVEPTVAACIAASLASGELTTVATGETSMAGLNCGTPAYLAWPDLKTGVAGAVAVDDAAAEAALVELADLAVDSGPCGSASLAALRVVSREPGRTSLDLTSTSTVLLLNTEGLASAR